MGNVYSKKGEMQKSLELYEESLQMKIMHFGKEHSMILNSLINMAINTMR